MAKPTLKTLRDEAQIIYQQYGARFAGKPRATRDLGALDALIDRLEAVVADGQTLSDAQRNGQRDPGLASVLEQAAENLDTYAGERQAIADVQADGQGAVAASKLATWANLHFGQYMRHFAGQPRPTRDVGLLNEIISQLELIESQMKKLAATSPTDAVRADLDSVQNNLSMYRDERDNILAARREASVDQQASYLAMVANGQFGVYNFHFAGRPRVSRRTATLHRVMATLDSVSEQMQQLDPSEDASDQNQANLELVADQIDTYGDEFDQIQHAHRQMSRGDRVGHLGTAANAAMEEYNEHFAGQDRSTRDLELLSRLCDELLDIGRQMRELADQGASAANDRNLKIVLDNLMLYQSEYEEIAELQQ